MADRDEQLAALGELSQRLDDLEASANWEVYLDRILYELALHQQTVLGGGLDEKRYSFECGFIAGAQAVREIPARVRAEYETLSESEEEDGA